MYDPMRYSDNYESEEEYLKELEEEKCLQQKKEKNTSEEVTSQR